MLNGIDPVIIFEFSKAIKEKGASGVPVAKSVLTKLPLPYIPIYLSEKLTGIYIDTEEKNIDITTDIENYILKDDSTEETEHINQKPIANVIKITMLASKDSIGMTLLSALSDKILPLVTSKEYAITYVHGAIVVLSGLLHSFSISQNSNDELYHITMELIKPAILQITKAVDVSAPKNAVSLVSGKAVGT